MNIYEPLQCDRWHAVRDPVLTHAAMHSPQCMWHVSGDWNEILTNWIPRHGWCTSSWCFVIEIEIKDDAGENKALVGSWTNSFLTCNTFIKMECSFLQRSFSFLIASFSSSVVFRVGGRKCDMTMRNCSKPMSSQEPTSSWCWFLCCSQKIATFRRYELQFNQFRFLPGEK